jgi:hypothetical protein
MAATHIRGSVENRYTQAFGVTLYFAICHACDEWVKSSIGQSCWVEPTNRDRTANAHRRFHI